MPSALFETVQAQFLTRHKELERVWATVQAEMADRRRQIEGAAAVYRTQNTEALQQLGSSMERHEARWSERLRRLSEWGSQLQHIERQQSAIEGFLDDLLWRQRASETLNRLTAFTARRAAGWAQDQRQIHQSLQQWLAALETQGKALHDLKQREASLPRPLYISKARKRPESAQVEQHATFERDLGARLRRLRMAVNNALQRLDRFQTEWSRRAQRHQSLFSAYQAEIERSLHQARQTVIDLREEILSDALTFEMARRKHAWIRENVKSLRCIEDFGAPTYLPRGWLRQLFPR